MASKCGIGGVVKVVQSGADPTRQALRIEQGVWQRQWGQDRALNGNWDEIWVGIIWSIQCDLGWDATVGASGKICTYYTQSGFGFSSGLGAGLAKAWHDGSWTNWLGHSWGVSGTGDLEIEPLGGSLLPGYYSHPTFPRFYQNGSLLTSTAGNDIGIGGPSGNTAIVMALQRVSGTSMALTKAHWSTPGYAVDEAELVTLLNYSDDYTTMRNNLSTATGGNWTYYTTGSISGNPQEATYGYFDGLEICWGGGAFLPLEIDSILIKPINP